MTLCFSWDSSALEKSPWPGMLHQTADFCDNRSLSNFSYSCSLKMCILFFGDIGSSPFLQGKPIQQKMCRAPVCLLLFATLPKILLWSPHLHLRGWWETIIALLPSRNSVVLDVCTPNMVWWHWYWKRGKLLISLQLRVVNILHPYSCSLLQSPNIFLSITELLNHNLNISVGNWSLLHPFRLSGENAFLFHSLQTHFFNLCKNLLYNRAELVGWKDG